MGISISMMTTGLGANIDDLEEFLREHKVPYERQTASRYEYDAEEGDLPTGHRPGGQHYHGIGQSHRGDCIFAAGGQIAPRTL